MKNHPNPWLTRREKTLKSLTIKEKDSWREFQGRKKRRQILSVFLSKSVVKKSPLFDDALGAKMRQIHPKDPFFFEKRQRVGTKEGTMNWNLHHSIFTIHQSTYQYWTTRFSRSVWILSKNCGDWWSAIALSTVKTSYRPGLIGMKTSANILGK